MPDKMFSGGDVPFIKVYNLTHNGRLDFSVKPTFIERSTHRGLLARSKVFPGDILTNIVGPPLGKVSLVPPDHAEWNINQAIVVFRPVDQVSRQFLAYALLTDSVLCRITKLAKATAGQCNIGVNMCRTMLPIPLAPADEQRRIVAKIDELFSDLDVAVATLQRVKAKLKRYRASVLKAAIDGKLTAGWRRQHPTTEPATTLLERIIVERRRRWEDAQQARFTAAGKMPPANWQEKYPEPAGPDTATLPPLPENWCWASVDQLSEIQGGIQKQPKRAPVSNAYPFLRVANVYRGRLDLSDVHRIELFDGELERLRLETGDLLIVEGNGSITEIGRSAIWSGEIGDCVHQNHLIRVRLVLCEPRFFDAYWNSPFGNNKVMAVAASTSGLYTLSVSKVSSLPVPLPPLEEQAAMIEEIERRLSVVDQVIAQVDVNLKRAGRLRQGILKRAFEGKLVPQIATDEPATVLLERIRQQRQAAPQKPARKPVGGELVRAVLENLGRAIAYCLSRAKKPHGRTWLAKVLAIGELHVGIPFKQCHGKYPHGPFDDVIYKAERVGRKAGWFDFTEQKKAKEQTSYLVTAGTQAAAALSAEFMGDQKVKFDELLDNFDDLNSDEAELFATVYVAWNDLLLDGRPDHAEACHTRPR